MAANAEPKKPVDPRMQETKGFSADTETILLHWSRNGKQLARPLKITLICFFAATFVLLTALNTINEIKHVNLLVERKTEVAERLLKNQKFQAIAFLQEAAKSLTETAALLPALESGSAAEISSHLDRVVPAIPGNQHISEFGVYDTQLNLVAGRAAFKVEPQASTSGLVAKAAQSGLPASGLEPGMDGSPSLTIAAPWQIAGKTAGYVRLAVEMRQALLFIHSALDIGIVEFQPAQLVQRDLNAQILASRHWRFRGETAYRPVGSLPLPEELDAHPLDPNGNASLFDRLFITGDRVLVTSSLTLPYADGSDRPSLLLTHDISGDIRSLLERQALSVLFFGVIALVTWALFQRLSNGIQRAVKQTRRQLEHAVRENTKALELHKDRLEEAQHIAAIGSWERNLRTGEINWSDQIFTIAGIPRSLSPSEAHKAYYSMVPPADLQAILKAIKEHKDTCTPFELEHQLIRKDGEVRHLHVRCNFEAGPDGKALRMFGTTHDVTEQHNALDRSQWLADILEASLNEIYIFNGDTFLCEHANRCARDNLRYTGEQVQSLHLWDISEEADRDKMLSMIATVLDGRQTSLKVESWHKRSDGSVYPVEVRLQAHKSRSKTSLIAICNDITERIAREKETRLAREEAERLAYFDTLTKLPNRAACQRDAKAAFSPEAEKKPAFIIHIDIDNFKRINDTLGHSAGDSCLEETGERLQTGCFGLGTAYRWGGDEFVIIASGPDANAEELCERLNLVMRAPMEYEGNQIWPSVSMGVARCPDDGDDFASLLVHADLALYRSKDEGKDRWSYFTSDMKIDSDQEARLEHELRLALRRDEFFLVFQPQVNNRTQQVTGVEALVRWRHPTRGVLAPGAFLNVVEKTSLAVPLGQIVLDKAIAAAGRWKKSGLHFGRMAVNLSPSHLPSGTLLQDFLTAMAKYDVGPELLTAEVLESVFLDNERNHNWQVLEELYDRGIHIELDDFGTGYASLAHVADLPINGLKIDRSFTAQILTDTKKEIVVNHLIHLARALNINVVCEGVETETQFERLRMMGNFSVQGYLIARPMPFEQMTDWLEACPGDLAFLS